MFAAEYHVQETITHKSKLVASKQFGEKWKE